MSIITRLRMSGEISYYQRKHLLTNYVLVETCALVQHRLGMPAIEVFQEDIIPVLRIEWIDHAAHQTAVGIMLTAKRKSSALLIV